MNFISKKPFPRIITFALFICVWAHCSAQPSVTFFDPASGPVGTVVTITGQNFSPTPEDNIVFFGAVRAIVTEANPTALLVSVPPSASFAPVTVSVNGLTASSMAPFIITFPSDDDLSLDSFGPRIDLSTPNDPIYFSVGDLNNDGKLDVVIPNYQADKLSIVENLNAGGPLSLSSFATRRDLQTRENPARVTLADVDANGYLDIICANDFGSDISIWPNSGDIADFSTTNRIDIPAGAHPVGVKVADFDGDGRLDLAVVNAVLGPSSVSIHRNTNDAGGLSANTFAEGVHFTTGLHSFKLAVADFDGDGRLDIATADLQGSISLLRNTATPGTIDAFSFTSGGTIPVPTSVASIEAADLDHDGKPDLAVSRTGFISLFRNTGLSGTLNASSFGQRIDLPVRDQTQGELAVGDLNGDGKPDLAAAVGSFAEVFVFQNVTGPGNLAFALTANVPAAGRFVRIADLNCDGKPELISAAGNTLSINQNRAEVTDRDRDGLLDTYEEGVSRYQVIEGAFTWLEARDDAEARGGHIATITSQEEFELVNGLGLYLGGIALGGTDEDDEGNYRWITGEPWGFTDWGTGEPSNSGNSEHYLQVSGLPGNPWSDIVGTETLVPHYLLEFGYYSDPDNPDTDGDGLLDGDEINRYGTFPNVADSDGDGFSDHAEVFTGKDPLDPEEFPDVRLRAFFALEVEFPSNINDSYQVQISGDLEHWENLGTPIQGTGGIIQRLYSVHQSNARSYRVEVIDTLAP